MMQINFPFILAFLSLTENAFWTLYTTEILSIPEFFLETNSTMHLQSLFVPY